MGCLGRSTVLWGAFSFCWNRVSKMLFKNMACVHLGLWVVVWKTNTGSSFSVFDKLNWTTSSLSVAFYLFLADLKHCSLLRQAMMPNWKSAALLSLCVLQGEQGSTFVICSHFAALGQGRTTAVLSLFSVPSQPWIHLSHLFRGSRSEIAVSPLAQMLNPSVLQWVFLMELSESECFILGLC